MVPNSEQNPEEPHKWNIPCDQTGSVRSSAPHLLLLPAPCRPVIGRRLHDAVQRQVVNVDMAVGGTPGEAERGGVE